MLAAELRHRSTAAYTVFTHTLKPDLRTPVWLHEIKLEFNSYSATKDDKLYSIFWWNLPLNMKYRAKFMINDPFRGFKPAARVELTVIAQRYTAS